MIMTRMRWLLVAWWCATVVPGAAIALLVPADLVNDAASAVILVWILGYVAQLVLFMAVSRRLEGGAAMVAIWCVVSFLPWAVDWFVLAAWWAGLAFVVAATAVAAYLDVSSTSAAADRQRNELAAAASVPPAAQGQQTSGRVIWRFTSWHGPASSAPDQKLPPKQPRAAPVKATYAPYAPTSSAGEGHDLAGQLRELAALHGRGQLTDEEFALAKYRLLGDAEDSAASE